MKPISRKLLKIYSIKIYKIRFYNSANKEIVKIPKGLEFEI